MIALEELRTALKNPASEDDAYITALEQGAVALMERRTGKYFGGEEERTEYLVGKGGQTLYLSGPSGAVATVTEAAYPGTTGEDITDGVVARGTKLIRTDGYQWAKGYEYAVTYTRGWAEGAEPHDIRQAVRQLVTLWYEHRLPVSEAGATPLPAGVESVIASHRAPKV